MISKTILDLTFFVIYTTVGLNIVFGIIVDTFAGARDQKVRNINYIELCNDKVRVVSHIRVR